MNHVHELMAEVATKYALSDELSIWFDGSVEPTNPGGTGTCGWVIRNGHGDTLCAESCSLGSGPAMTNNVAEWTALGKALRWLLDNSFKGCTLRIFGDSKLVIEQLNGTWRCNMPHLQKLKARCHEIISELRPAGWTATWIPREQNSEADALSQRAYEDSTGKKYPARR